MSTFFQGRYYKHQKDNYTIAIIIGTSTSGDFLQVITNEEVLQYDNKDGCHISKKGLHIDYPEVKGNIYYGKFLKLRTPIMGPFHYLPMQCSHEVISMKHTLMGSLLVKDRLYDFNGGTGYIEGDYGRSFPEEYLWLTCNDFKEDLSIMLSIAHIPFLGMHFTGCICAITYKGKEYRLATYKGVKVLVLSEKRIVLKQGNYQLTIRLVPAHALPLRSPKKGHMIGTIKESNSTQASFRFSRRGSPIFQTGSKNCSYEFHYRQ